MVKFAKFQSRATDIVDLIVEVGPMNPTDTEVCAQLAASREGMDLSVWSDHFQRLLDAPGQLVLVARLEEHIVGYGKAPFLEPSQQGGRGAPEEQRNWAIRTAVCAGLPGGHVHSAVSESLQMAVASPALVAYSRVDRSTSLWMKRSKVRM